MPALISVNAIQCRLLLVSVISFDIFIKALKPSLCFQNKRHDGDYCGDFSTPYMRSHSLLSIWYILITFFLIQGSCCCLCGFFVFVF